ncbi:MAG: LTA synthase family protein [Proteobacteria bacterium]|nr:LTA synthase family protein [Pseudomonadota bacterium]MBU1581831.1 LTA synthase family protein [Pseudomonadota bacterium]MBU2627891.1 LTA synthase family protein [Pseudomonadota bacterium]
MRPNPDLIISHIGFLPFCLEDFISFYRISKNTKKQLSQADKKLLLDYYQSIKSNKNEYTGKFKGFNLFLLQFESLSNIVINQKINGHEITPTVNRLIREGIYFSQFYTQEGAGPTTSSEFVTLNSIIAPTDSFVAISYRFNTFYTLANLFNLEGYHTFALHGNNGSYYNREFIYERYGFDEFYSKKRIDGQIVHRWIGDKDLLKKASEVAANCNSLFFGFPIMVTSHKNWDISSVFDLDTGSHPFSGRSEGYVKNINYSDQAIQLFLDRLEKSRLLENTIIMIYGDHSPKLLKKEIESIIGHDVTDLESKRLRVQIPFILWAPKGSIEPKVIHDVFPQIDVLPTIANLFDLGTHFGIGKDIFDIKNTNIACTQEFIITKNATYHKFNQSEMQVASGSTKEQPLKDVKPLCDIQMRISDLILRTDAVQYLKSLKE